MYSKGISWIDDCRIPFVDGGWGKRIQDTKTIFGSNGLNTTPNGEQNDLGRFPANILVSDDMLNDGVISKSVGGKGKIDKNEIFGEIKTPQNYFNFNDKGTNSRYYDIDKWFEKLLDV
jgi:hypothetical protein